MGRSLMMAKAAMNTRYTIDDDETLALEDTLAAHLSDPFPNWRLIRVIEHKHTETYIIEYYRTEQVYSISTQYDQDGEIHYKVVT